ncbi:MAG: polysaccharide lyase family protein [Limisphaerales bacterium]
MRRCRFAALRCFLGLLIFTSFARSVLLAADGHPSVAKPTMSARVTVTDNGPTWTLDNGIVKAAINKSNSHMTSLVYRGINAMGPGGIWEQTPSGQVTQSLTIDPATNGGERAEVALKGVNGRMDIEVRYAMERGSSGIYTYAIFSHGTNYPAAQEGESRFITQLTPLFDWLSVDEDRNMLEPTPEDLRAGVVIHAKEQRILSTGIYKNSVEHKYSYCAVQYKIPAYGFSSTKEHIGLFFINPSTEYLSGGASKLDLVCHMQSTILDYWCSGHYAGGAGCNIPAGENWNKVIGPIFVYCNALTDPEVPAQADLDTLAATAGNPTVPPAWRDNAIALWRDALDRAEEEKARWPYNWVNGVDYPHQEGRGAVTGQLVLNDPQASSTKLPHLTVGLAHPEFTSDAGGFVLRSGNGNRITWEHDGNYYQFWNEGADDGKFIISNVRPGTYTLHAFADGVLGEYTSFNVTVAAGQTLDLGKLEWKPVRYGKQVWEIGYPDRTGGKFYKGDGSNYWLWGWCVRYGDLFPNDITYTIGKSDYHKDWFFEQVPHALSDAWKNPEVKDPLNQRFGWVKAGSPGEDMWHTIGRGRATTWTIRFTMDKAPKGEAFLRVALAGADGTGGLAVAVNGTNVGVIRPVATNALRYNTDTGVWEQYTQPFDAALLRPGENEMQLTVPAGELTSGVVYDYLRLEVNEDSKFSSKS